MHMAWWGPRGSNTTARFPHSWGAGIQLLLLPPPPSAFRDSPLLCLPSFPSSPSPYLWIKSIWWCRSSSAANVHPGVNFVCSFLLVYSLWRKCGSCFCLFEFVRVKRNAERYMFPEPRAPVDAVRARIRESRTCIQQAEAVVNFFAILVKEWLLGPKIPFYEISAFRAQNRFLAPKCAFSPKIAFGPKGAPFSFIFHWFYRHPRHGGAKVHLSAKDALLGLASRKKSENAQFG